MSKLEICAANPASVRIAAENGADRVELCSALSLDGLTPSAGMIEYAVSFDSLKVHVLIRPREGNFAYTPDEISLMVRDIETARHLGADGVVIGALRHDGTIDTEACRRMISAAGDMSVTFHRAFDTVPDPFTALEDIISLGCSRVLTSGQARTAAEGIDLLAALHRKAAGRIIILAGAGVNPDNAVTILRDGLADELHGSLSEVATDGQRISSPAQIRKVCKTIKNRP